MLLNLRNHLQLFRLHPLVLVCPFSDFDCNSHFFAKAILPLYVMGPKHEVLFNPLFQHIYKSSETRLNSFQQDKMPLLFYFSLSKIIQISLI